jgi:Cu-Zn family superoxide dismutase
MRHSIGHARAPRAHPMRRLVLSLAVPVLAACAGGSSTLPNDPRSMPELLDPRPSSGAVGNTVLGPAYVAQLRPVGGSAAQGAVTASQREGGIVVEINLTNVMPGWYAWALHERGSCNSPNGFSAGAPWAPSGVKKFPVDLLPEFLVNADQSAFVTARVRDARIGGDGGINGRSVLIYYGAGIKPIQAGVPNNVVACGVFEAGKTLF